MFPIGVSQQCSCSLFLAVSQFVSLLQITLGICSTFSLLPELSEVCFVLFFLAEFSRHISGEHSADLFSSHCCQARVCYRHIPVTSVPKQNLFVRFSVLFSLLFLGGEDHISHHFHKFQILKLKLLSGLILQLYEVHCCPHRTQAKSSDSINSCRSDMWGGKKGFLHLML